MNNNPITLTKPPLFFENLNTDKRIVINQGGTSSGKTYTILDVLFILATQEKNQVITVVGQDIPNLKKGAYRDARQIWSNSPLYQQWIEKPNETERLFHCHNGSVIEFNSYHDEQDAKSGKRDYLFVNEADGIPYPIYWQLQARTRKKIYIDYNPTARFWAHDMVGQPEVKLIISDHRNNPYLTLEQHQRVEEIKDKELWKVYARGLTGKLEGQVYTDWSLVDELPEQYKKRWIGLDFGFTNDPTSIIEVRLHQGQLWLHEVEYSTGMLNSDIAACIKQHQLHALDIVADSAEPKSIAELRSHKLKVEPAQKGPDSILNGIDIVKRYHLNVTRTSLNLRRELTAYRWKPDRYGSPTNQPIDAYNHLLDPLRYIALNKLREKKAGTGIKRISF
jgi:phage terminase large subunit